MTRKKSERNISRQNLRAHGIHYSDNGTSILPESVSAVRDMLLSFERILPDGRWKDTLGKEESIEGFEEIDDSARRPPDTAWIHTEDHEADLNVKNPKWLAAYQSMASCHLVAKEAQELSRDSEDGWMFFWRMNTFDKVSGKARDQPGFHPVLDRWSLDGDYAWLEFPNLEPCGTKDSRSDKHNHDRHPRTRPKPDLTYAFPILHHPLERLSAFERDDLCRTFSLQSLGELSKMGVICGPTTGLRKWTQSPQNTFLSTKDLACFPWAIVEFKKQVQGSEVAPKERCYCQAANASAAALALQAQLSVKAMEATIEKGRYYQAADASAASPTLQAQLSAKAREEQKLRDDACSRLLPIISFTCVGPIVKVWLTYYKERSNEGQREREMVCIWSTSVQLTWGVAALRAIIRNMHIWASRLLKPRLQIWVLQALQTKETPQESPISKPATPYNGPVLASLFGSPQLNTPNTPKPTPSANTQSPSRSKESTPCRLARRSEAVCMQRTTPSLLGQHTRGFTSPRTRQPTTTLSPEETTSACVAASETTKDSIELQANTVPQIKIFTTLPEAGSVSGTRASDKFDLDKITRSLELSSLKDVVDIVDSGSRSLSSSKTTIWERLASPDILADVRKCTPARGSSNVTTGQDFGGLFYAGSMTSGDLGSQLDESVERTRVSKSTVLVTRSSPSPPNSDKPSIPSQPQDQPRNVSPPKSPKSPPQSKPLESLAQPQFTPVCGLCGSQPVAPPTSGRSLLASTKLAASSKLSGSLSGNTLAATPASGDTRGALFGGVLFGGSTPAASPVSSITQGGLFSSSTPAASSASNVTRGGLFGGSIPAASPVSSTTRGGLFSRPRPAASLTSSTTRRGLFGSPAPAASSAAIATRGELFGGSTPGTSPAAAKGLIGCSKPAVDTAPRSNLFGRSGPANISTSGNNIFGYLRAVVSSAPSSGPFGASHLAVNLTPVSTVLGSSSPIASKFSNNLLSKPESAPAITSSRKFFDSPTPAPSSASGSGLSGVTNLAATSSRVLAPLGSSSKSTGSTSGGGLFGIRHSVAISASSSTSFNAPKPTTSSAPVGGMFAESRPVACSISDSRSVPPDSPSSNTNSCAKAISACQPISEAAPSLFAGLNGTDSGSDSETAYETEDDHLDSVAHSEDEDEDNDASSEEDGASDTASEPSVSDCESSSQSDDGAYGITQHTRHYSRTDQAWLIGMGSLSGYELARAPYLRTIFQTRSKNKQISMIRDVVGDGPMSGDRYWLNGDDLLDHVLRFLNSHLTFSSIWRSHFRKSLEISKITSAISRIRVTSSSEKDRFHCFQKALMMRSVSACSSYDGIIFRDSFDLDGKEWAAWEDSALLLGRERPFCDHE